MNNKSLSMFAMFTAMSAVGGSIKIPSVLGSIALDTLPALMAAALIGAVPGALVAVAGHSLSALFAGLPLGLFHILIALEMALFVFLFGHFYRKGRKVFATLLFAVGNMILAPLPFIALISLSFYLAILPSLMLGTTVNLALALMGIRKLKDSFISRQVINKEWNG